VGSLYARFLIASTEAPDAGLEGDMSDLRTLVGLLGKRFVQRKDVKSWQQENGVWLPDRSPMTMADFEAHLAGTKTMGHYLLDHEGNCKLFAFDLDLVKHARACVDTTCKGCAVMFPAMELSKSGNPQTRTDVAPYMGIPRDLWRGDDQEVKRSLFIQLNCLAQGLALRTHKMTGLPVAIATSGGKGLHVYCFTGSMPAVYVRQVAHGILEEATVYEKFRGDNFWRHQFAYEVLDIEVFPKQDTLNGKDLGNLMALPLGIHRLTKKPKAFLSMKGRLDKMMKMDPEHALSGDLPWE
jgi:hypothetical protein